MMVAGTCEPTVLAAGVAELQNTLAREQKDIAKRIERLIAAIEKRYRTRIGADVAASRRP